MCCRGYLSGLLVCLRGLNVYVGNEAGMLSRSLAPTGHLLPNNRMHSLQAPVLTLPYSLQYPPAMAGSLDWEWTVRATFCFNRVVGLSTACELRSALVRRTPNMPFMLFKELVWPGLSGRQSCV